MEIELVGEGMEQEEEEHPESYDALLRLYTFFFLCFSPCFDYLMRLSLPFSHF